MTKELIGRYMNTIKYMDDKEYLYGVLSYNIAPTLAGHKPSSIITLSDKKRNLSELWHLHKKEFINMSNLDFYELKITRHSVTILFYNKNELFKVLTKKDNMKFLKRFNYSNDLCLEEMLHILKSRFQQVCPHEMGIFLGFPLEDVICFMDNPEKQCLMCGYWKVYYNMELARKTFLNYDIAREEIINSILQGLPPSIVLTA